MCLNTTDLKQMLSAFRISDLLIKELLRVVINHLMLS